MEFGEFLVSARVSFFRRGGKSSRLVAAARAVGFLYFEFHVLEGSLCFGAGIV